MSSPSIINCNTVEEFLRQLLDVSIWGPYDQFVQSSPWVFRGHGDSEWELKPAAWRIDGQKKLAKIREHAIESMKSSSYQGHALEFAIQSIAERLALEHFMLLSDELGLPVTAMSDYNPLQYDLNGIKNGDDKITDQLRWDPSIFALAQHHGVPTRLLDWSRVSLVAAFHAAESAQREKTKGRLCVWAANIDLTGAVLDASDELDVDYNIWQSVTRSDNPYLHAQSGIFSYFSEPLTFLHKHERLPAFQDGIRSDQPLDGQDVLRCITLPVSQVRELLAALAQRHISLAHLKPTFDNVVSTLMERWAGGS